MHVGIFGRMSCGVNNEAHKCNISGHVKGKSDTNDEHENDSKQNHEDRFILKE